MKTQRRNYSFWTSELPLTSKRANYILSRPKESKRLIQAIRESRITNKRVVINFSSQDIAKRILEL